MTALRRLARLFRPEPRAPYKPRHALPQFGPDDTQPIALIGDPR